MLDICLETYELYPAYFPSAPGLVWQAAFKMTKVVLDLLTDFDMLLTAEKSISNTICHGIYRYTKANSKHMKDHGKNKETLHLIYWDVNNLCGCVISQKLPVDDSKWVENTS